MFTSPRWKPLATGLGVTLLAAALSRLAPLDQAANLVALLFAGATYWLVLRHDAETIRAHGLTLGGLFEPTPLSVKRLLQDTLHALGWAGVFCALTFPLFWLGYRVWFGVNTPFVWFIHSTFPDEALGQLLVIALPEEMFYRGYLQSALQQFDQRRVKVLGAELGVSLIVSSFIFALGHLLATPHVSRLAVFFPSLLFGYLHARTGAIGSAVLYHALCNLFSAWLAQGYALHAG